MNKIKDVSPPYLSATGDLEHEGQSPVFELDTGGTPTPIPVRNCLSFEREEEIVLYFVRIGKQIFNQLLLNIF
jgi:hypothetical protein